MPRNRLRALDLWLHARYDVIRAIVIMMIAFAPAPIAWYMKPAGPSDRIQRAKLGSSIAYGVQEEVAYHEAAHALAIKYTFGPDHIESLQVWTRNGEEGLLGVVRWRKWPNTATLPDALQRAVVSLAGRAADKIINGAPDVGSRLDLQHATEVMMRFRLEYGLGGTLVVKPSATAQDYTAVETLLRKANACAEALVEQNRDNIVRLGKYVLSKKPEDGKRTLSHDELAQYFSDHPVAPATPLETPFELTDDPCFFPTEADSDPL